MSELERIGVSLDQELLKEFDAMLERKHYPNRSEAIRDLIREKLSDDHLAEPDNHAIATVCLVYDHHRPQLTHKIMSLQHSKYLKTISTMHVHLDHDDCLEVIILKGKVAEITKLGDALISLKGVKQGKLNLMAVAEYEQGHVHHGHGHEDDGHGHDHKHPAHAHSHDHDGEGHGSDE